MKKIPLSLDTRKSWIMNKGIETGAKIINDISGLKFDSQSISIFKKKMRRVNYRCWMW